MDAIARASTNVATKNRDESCYGVYPAVVMDIKDPDGQGRVKIGLPWMPDPQGAHYEAWARLATLMAGANRGSWFIPDVGDEVLVAFEGGDTRSPYVIGSLWNGKDTPPESMDGSGQNLQKVLRSRNGVKITLDDRDGQEKFRVETPDGQKIQLRDGPGGVEISDTNGNVIRMEASSMTLNASAKITINSTKMVLNAGSLDISAGMSKFSGSVKCDTMIANNVVASSYTPGAGNIL